jgi:hypothetical protein
MRKRGDKANGFIPSFAGLASDLNTGKGNSYSNRKKVYAPSKKIINKQ